MRNKSQSSLILSKSRSPSLFFSDFQLFSYCFVQFPHSKKLFFSVSLTQFLIFSYSFPSEKSRRSSPEHWLPFFFVSCLPFFVCFLSLLSLPSRHWQRFKSFVSFFTLVFWDPIFSAWVPRVLNPGPCFPPASPIKSPGACVFAASLVPLARGTRVNLFWDHLTKDSPHLWELRLLPEPPEWQQLPRPWAEGTASRTQLRRLSAPQR